MNTPKLVMVVAMGENRCIGSGGKLPWNLATDLKRYRQLTMGKPMIMGRKTLDSIGRVLDGRDSIVLTRQGKVAHEGAIVAHDLEEAVRLAGNLARARGADEIAVIGGGEIFTAMLERSERLYVTHVEASPEGDAFFPPLDDGEWRTVHEEHVPKGERDSAASRFVIYERC